MRKLMGILFFCAVCFFSVVQGGTQWMSLHERVDHSKELLSQTQSRWEQVQSALHQVEKLLAAQAKLLRKTKQSIANNHFALYVVEKRLKTNKARLAEQIAVLSQSLRAMSQWVNQPPLKWVFSSDDPSQWSRIARYQQYIGQAQMTRLAALKRTQQLIVVDQKRLVGIQAVLLGEKEKRASVLSALKKGQLRRAVLAHDLRFSVQEQRRALEVMQKSLSVTVERASSGYHVGEQGFITLKQHLVWPVKGHLQPLFGSALLGGDFHWQGVLFSAPQDFPVRAVAPGRVVYADWLSGFGWLLIIDHGKGYMSLYGRNHYLIKRVGAWVKQGVLLARVGQSGGFSSPALYFAIRHNAKAVNPAQWLSKHYVGALKRESHA